ncbi:non-heme iron oxygenase ferredoxin subunit [Alicyclobacillaceae bacterium I2511]|jgi:nitrite reductase/ring-hydroxylating ferredoxin subunit|nr:non-heme iron oxygenase ferredoxin subunit [Alicyclobacillaceae bacterium I2511]
MTWIPIGKETEVPLAEMKRFTVEDTDIAVYHLNKGWYASIDLCTHQDCSLVEGEIENEEIVCPCHGGAFNIVTGKATRMPCVAPVETFPIRVVNGLIEVDFT